MPKIDKSNFYQVVITSQDYANNPQKDPGFNSINNVQLVTLYRIFWFEENERKNDLAKDIFLIARKVAFIYIIGKLASTKD